MTRLNHKIFFEKKSTDRRIVPKSSHECVNQQITFQLHVSVCPVYPVPKWVFSRMFFLGFSLAVGIAFHWRRRRSFRRSSFLSRKNKRWQAEKRINTKNYLRQKHKTQANKLLSFKYIQQFVNESSLYIPIVKVWVHLDKYGSAYLQVKFTLS